MKFYKKITGILLLLLCLLGLSLTAQAAVKKNLGVKVSNTGYRKLKITIPAVSGAKKYRIYYSRTTSGYRLLKKTNKTSITVKSGKLRQSGTYQIRVRVVRDGQDWYQNCKVSMKKKYLGQGKTVAIDAGHQRNANNGLEPIGPGASTKKAKVSSGTVGCVTGIPEYQLNLTVSKKLAKELRARGYRVVMIRTSHDVNLSNKERAEIANKSGADIFLRIHGNSSSDSSVHGAETLCPTAGSPYISSLYPKCRKLSDDVLAGLCKATGAYKRSVWETDIMSGINWCKIPVTIVEMGFMSNPAEDRKLNSGAYQKKIVKGITNGVGTYFGRND